MKKATKLISFCLCVLMAFTLGTTTVLAANDDIASSTPTTQSDGTGSTKKAGAQKGEKSGTRVNVLSIAASVLGKTQDEIKEAVKTGKVGDLLIAAGKVEAFKTEYLAQTKTKLAAAVAAGTLTQAEADKKYAEAQAKMSAYDGTTHLCGGTDHSKMAKAKDSNGTNEKAAA